MKINYVNKTIELTKAEMKAAEAYGSQAYKNLMNARRDNPDYRVVVIKAKRVKSSLDKLTMATVRAYVKAHGDAAQKQTFLDMSVAHYTDEDVYIEAKPFFEIKKWFLAEFPKYKDALDSHEEAMKNIFAAVDEKIANAKAEAIKKAMDAAKKEAEEFLKAS